MRILLLKPAKRYSPSYFKEKLDFVDIYIYIKKMDEGVEKLGITATFIRQLVSVRFTCHFQVNQTEELRQI